MNEKQRLYLVQAQSDWNVYQFLKSQPICHRLHYFQMCTEKLAKAYFWKNPGAGNLGHAAFVEVCPVHGDEAEGGEQTRIRQHGELRRVDQGRLRFGLRHATILVLLSVLPLGYLLPENLKGPIQLGQTHHQCLGLH